MSKCSNCGIEVNCSDDRCPICHCEILRSEDVYPQIIPKYRNHELFLNILLFIVVSGCSLTMFIEYMLSYTITWSLFVCMGIISIWLIIKTAIKHKKTFSKMLFSLFVLGIIISFLFDYTTGMHKWSYIYVIPFMSVAFSSFFIVVRTFVNKASSDLIFYGLINGLLGFLPLVLLIKMMVVPRWPSIIGCIFGFCTLFFVLIFDSKVIKEEVIKYLHL